MAKKPKVEVVAPIIHMNGSSKDRLIEALSNAYDKFSEAYDALRQCAPNGRDYYLEDGRFDKARDQHIRRLGAVAGVMESLDAEMTAIQEQD